MVRRVICWGLGLTVGLSVTLATAQTCRRVFATPQNAKQCITVSTTAIDVAQPNTSRCSLLIQNTSVNIMNCSDFGADGAPTTTTGTPIAGGGKLELRLEGQGRWQCIRAGAADATACIAEGRP